MRILWGGVVALACALGGTEARAGSDYRWHDRFFFGFDVGALDPTPAGQADTGRTFVAGFEQSYWANDYFGARMAFSASSYADDWGAEAFGAVPLRYVQLYGGPHLGLRNVRGMSTGVDGQLHLVVGVQGYLGRNGRLFVQWEDPPVEAIRLGPNHADAVMAGLRWSPDFFHAARPLNKIDMAYVPFVLTFFVWGIASASQ